MDRKDTNEGTVRFEGCAMSDAERRRLSSSERLLRLFREAFSVMDLAEPLLSLDETASRAQARELMRREAGCHLGVRRDGRVVDKLGLLVKDERHRELLRFKSRRDARKTIKQLESLRNNLAHAQPVEDDNWQAMQMLSAAVDGIVSAPRARALVEGIQRDAAQSDAD